MDLADLILGIVGAVSTLALIYDRFIRRWGARRLVGFDTGTAVDIICTTGGENRSKYGTSAAKRALAPEGELQGVAAVANALGRWYPRAQVVPQMSNRATRKLDRDLVLIGGPAGNKCSAEVLNWSSLKDLVHLDAPNSSLRVGQFSVDKYDHRFVAGRPERDLAVIVCSRNKWSPHAQRRLFMFAGLTTYGTGAAPEFFFENIASDVTPFTREIRRALRKPRTVLLVVEASFNNGYLSGCNLTHHEIHDLPAEHVTPR